MGVLSYVVIKLVSGRYRSHDVYTAVFFVIRFIFFV